MRTPQLEAGSVVQVVDALDSHDLQVLSDRDRGSQRILASRFPRPMGIHAQTKGAIVIG